MRINETVYYTDEEWIEVLGNDYSVGWLGQFVHVRYDKNSNTIRVWHELSKKSKEVGFSSSLTDLKK